MVSPAIFSSGHEPAKRLIRHFLRPLVSNPVGRWQEVVSVRNKTYFSRHCEQATTEPVKGDIIGKIQILVSFASYSMYLALHSSFYKAVSIYQSVNFCEFFAYRKGSSMAGRNIDS